MKILFYATYPNQGIGYSRIGNKISNFLASKNHDVYYFGISNFINDKQEVKRYIHPNIKFIDALKEEGKNNVNDAFGISVFTKFVDLIKPDIIFLYNDIIVISRLLLQIQEYLKTNEKKFKLYLYLDLVYQYERIELIEFVSFMADKIFVFSEFWKEHLNYLLPKYNNVYIFYHGVDNDTFYSIDDIEETRKQLKFNKEDFLILNTNRNTYRKANDITITAFLLFLVKKGVGSDIKLVLNSHPYNDKSGYRYLSLIRSECIRLKLNYDWIIKNHIYNYDTPLSDELMNILYNSCNIGINTCIGEGFGLCNIEHAKVGKPQIISNVCAFKDIFKEVGNITYVEPTLGFNISTNMDDHGGYVEYCNAEDFAKKIEEVYDNYTNYNNIYKNFSKHLKRKYNWNDIFKKFYNDFLDSI
jgi:glycosyltransferase involved in cell wall biosynthesis